MNLKYYLRGLGLGILVTALVMGFAAGGRKESLSDEQIRTRAKELGMTEKTVLSEYEEETEKSVDESSTDAVEAEQQDAKAEEPKEQTEQPEEQTEQPEEQTAEPETQKEEPEQKIPEEQPQKQSTAEPAVFMIDRGDGSYTVSERLESAGLISSATEFDHYLVENGYDKKIVAGEHMIPTDADEDMIAKIITGQE